MPLDKVLYTAKAHTTGGRDGGASQSSDGRLDVKLSSPGGPGAGTNPEQAVGLLSLRDSSSSPTRRGSRGQLTPPSMPRSIRD